MFQSLLWDLGEAYYIFMVEDSVKYTMHSAYAQTMKWQLSSNVPAPKA